MLRYLFLFLILIHGLIHVLGFAKAFQWGDISQLSREISRPEGLFWLLATLLFVGTGLLYLIENEHWSSLAFSAIVLSQVLIFMAWSDAKFGTIANLLILLVALIGYKTQSFEQQFKEDVKVNIVRTSSMQKDLLTETDIKELPSLVQSYLRYVGVLNKPKVNNFKVLFKGEMREKGANWFSFTSEQYNFFDEPTRLFFIKAKVKGLPTNGYHAYQEDQAKMSIKLLSLFPVVDLADDALFKAETVTVFNDMCLLAPATLIDKRITWKNLDATSVKSTFTNKGISISAILHFNEMGQLINFESDDRYAVSEMKQYRFSTPVSSYKNINGYNLCQNAEAIWHYPEGKFTYGKFNLKWVMYNVSPKIKPS